MKKGSAISPINSIIENTINDLTMRCQNVCVSIELLLNRAGKISHLMKFKQLRVAIPHGAHC